jgi:hypothetical protein
MWNCECLLAAWGRRKVPESLHRRLVHTDGGRHSILEIKKQGVTMKGIAGERHFDSQLQTTGTDIDGVGIEETIALYSDKLPPFESHPCFLKVARSHAYNAVRLPDSQRRVFKYL